MAKRKVVETRFKSELKESVETIYPDGFYCKIPDMPRTSQSRFIPEKPFDVILAFNRKVVGIELKAHTKHTAWPFDTVRENQIEGLLRFERNGGDNAFACVLVNVRYGRGKARVNFARVFTIYEYLSLRDNSERKSLPINEMQKGLCLHRQKVRGRTVWPINQMLLWENLVG